MHAAMDGWAHHCTALYRRCNSSFRVFPYERCAAWMEERERQMARDAARRQAHAQGDGVHGGGGGPGGAVYTYEL